MKSVGLLKTVFWGSGFPISSIFALKTAKLNRNANCPGSCQYRLFSRNCLVPKSAMHFDRISSTSLRLGFLEKSPAFNPSNIDFVQIIGFAIVINILSHYFVTKLIRMKTLAVVA